MLAIHSLKCIPVCTLYATHRNSTLEEEMEALQQQLDQTVEQLEDLQLLHQQHQDQAVEKLESLQQVLLQQQQQYDLTIEQLSNAGTPAKGLQWDETAEEAEEQQQPLALFKDSTCDQLQEQLAELQERHAVVVQQLQDSQQRVSELEAEISSTAAASAEAQQQLEAAQQKADGLEQDLVSAREATSGVFHKLWEVRQQLKKAQEVRCVCVFD